MVSRRFGKQYGRASKNKKYNSWTHLFTAKLAQSPEEGGVCITEALITKRNLTFREDEDLSEKM